MNTLNKEEIKEILFQHVAVVTFTKKDGSERVMKCTLEPSYFPVKEETEKKRADNPEVISVWDIENSGWRSFRLDSIISFTPV